VRIVACLVVVACGSSSEPARPPPAAQPPKPQEPSPAPVETPSAPPVERRLHPIDVEASSFLEPNTQPYLQYHPRYAVDGDPKTAWNLGAQPSGAAEYLRFTVTPQRNVSRVRLRVLNGFQYNDAIYRANPRAKTIEVRFSPAGKPVHQQVLADDKAWQEITIPTEIAALDSIELDIVDAYPGAKYNDLAISEVEIYVTSRTPERPDVEKQHLDATLEWKKRQRELSLMAGAIDLVAGDELAEFSAEAEQLFERARHSLDGLGELTIRRNDLEVTARALAACTERPNSIDTACLAPVYSTSGLSVKERPPREIKHRADCVPTVRGSTSDGPIRELAIVLCENTPTRVAWDYRLNPVMLEYDDDGRLRAIAATSYKMWLEWGTRNGKPAIVGGAWRGEYEPPGRRVYALRQKP
jgi:hypothetical protein